MAKQQKNPNTEDKTTGAGTAVQSTDTQQNIQEQPQENGKSEEGKTQDPPPVNDEKPKSICTNPRCFNNMEAGEEKLDAIDNLLVESILGGVKALLADLKNEIIEACKPTESTTQRVVQSTNVEYVPKKKENKSKK